MDTINIVRKRHDVHGEHGRFVKGPDHKAGDLKLRTRHGKLGTYCYDGKRWMKYGGPEKYFLEMGSLVNVNEVSDEYVMSKKEQDDMGTLISIAFMIAVCIVFLSIVALTR